MRKTEPEQDPLPPEIVLPSEMGDVSTIDNTGFISQREETRSNGEFSNSTLDRELARMHQPLIILAGRTSTCLLCRHKIKEGVHYIIKRNGLWVHLHCTPPPLTPTANTNRYNIQASPYGNLISSPSSRVHHPQTPTANRNPYIRESSRFVTPSNTGTQNRRSTPRSDVSTTRQVPSVKSSSAVRSINFDNTVEPATSVSKSICQQIAFCYNLILY